MEQNNDFNQIAVALARHFDSLYYIDIETGHFSKYAPSKMLEGLNFPSRGDDFGMQSECMYHADRLWQEHIHPDDIKVYREAVDAVLCGNAELRAIKYRVRRADGKYVVCSARGFVLMDKDDTPEYFGGIIITE